MTRAHPAINAIPQSQKEIQNSNDKSHVVPCMHHSVPFNAVARV